MGNNFGTSRDRLTHLQGVPSSFDRAPDASNNRKETKATVPDITREEMNARLEASEARMATLAEGIRADNAAARADLAIGLRDIKGVGESIKAEASVFYADAARVLAEMHKAHAINKTETYAIGYKVITWVLGTLLTLVTVGLAVYKAWRDLHPQ